MLTVNGVPTPASLRVSEAIKAYHARKNRLANSQPQGTAFHEPLYVEAQAQDNALCAGGGELRNVKEMRIWYKSKTAGLWWVCKDKAHITKVMEKQKALRVKSSTLSMTCGCLYETKSGTFKRRCQDHKKRGRTYRSQKGR